MKAKCSPPGAVGLLFVLLCIGALAGTMAFLPASVSPQYRSQIEQFTANFSRSHKTWTENANTVASINVVFSDSLLHFYASHPRAFDNLALRLENVLDSGNGHRVASFECWDHFVDNKLLRAHVYATVPDSLKKLFTGNEYVLIGEIVQYDLTHGAGYNATDNSCDAGIITIGSARFVHLKGHNKPAGLDY